MASVFTFISGSNPDLSASMADLKAPLLFERREAEVIVDVTDGSAEANGAVDRSPTSGGVEVPENPFEFIGIDFSPLQPNRFVDPFRNHTLSIGGAYELFMGLILLPCVSFLQSYG